MIEIKAQGKPIVGVAQEIISAIKELKGGEIPIFIIEDNSKELLSSLLNTLSFRLGEKPESAEKIKLKQEIDTLCEIVKINRANRIKSAIDRDDAKALKAILIEGKPHLEGFDSSLSNFVPLLDELMYFQGIEGETSFRMLHYAAYNGKKNVVKYLLYIGADPTLTDPTDVPWGKNKTATQLLEEHNVTVFSLLSTAIPAVLVGITYAAFHYSNIVKQVQNRALEITIYGLGTGILGSILIFVTQIIYQKAQNKELTADLLAQNALNTGIFFITTAASFSTIEYLKEAIAGQIDNNIPAGILGAVASFVLGFVALVIKNEISKHSA